MTDYIEQLMETAGVKKQLDVCLSCLKEDICQYCNKKLLGEYIYPDFTAEKQLEIIKLIGKKYRFSTFTNIFSDNSVQYYCETKQPRIYHRAQAQDFQKALAQLATKLMNVDELDKEKVKEILER